jgi:hypothetical protein
MALVRELTIPTERLPLVGKDSATFEDKECRVVNAKDPDDRILRFLDRMNALLKT